MVNITKKAIKVTFARMLREKPLSEITVKSLSERCGINRNTFYYHYEDIPSLLNELVTDIFNSIIRKYPSIDSLEDGLIAIMKFSDKNRKAIGHVFDSAGRNIFEFQMWRMADSLSELYCTKFLEGYSISEDDFRLSVKLVRSLIAGLVFDWLNTGMKGDSEEEIHRICQICRGSIEEVIGRMENG